MSTPFSQDQLESLSLNIDKQLNELRNNPSPHSDSKAAKEPEQLPERTPKQWKAIAEVAPQTFWQRFKLAAYNDLCEEGGVLSGITTATSAARPCWSPLAQFSQQWAFPAYFQEMIGADHAFQVTVDAPFVDADWAKTFLSQLV